MTSHGLPGWRAGQGRLSVGRSEIAVEYVARRAGAARRHWDDDVAHILGEHFLDEVFPADVLDIRDEKVRVLANGLWHEFLLPHPCYRERLGSRHGLRSRRERRVGGAASR
jgi:hypothetical protein